MKRALLGLLSVTLLSGCAVFTPPLNVPVYEQHAKNRVNTFSVIPSRRMVIMKLDNSEGAVAAAPGGSHGEPGGNGEAANGSGKRNSRDRQLRELLICAEAPSDVSDNLVSSLTANLSAKKGEVGEVAAGVATAIQTSAQFLFTRTQGIQIYRDGMYHLCQARMNKFIANGDYGKRADELLAKAIELITLELRLKLGAAATAAPAGGAEPAAGGSTGSTAP